MTSHATSCIQTLDYLLAKHDRMLRELLTQPGALLTVKERDKPGVVPLTVEEHDRILAMCVGNSIASDKAVAHQVGRSHTLVRRIRLRQHKMFDAKRCAHLYPAS